MHPLPARNARAFAPLVEPIPQAPLNFVDLAKLAASRAPRRELARPGPRVAWATPGGGARPDLGRRLANDPSRDERAPCRVAGPPAATRGPGTGRGSGVSDGEKAEARFG